MGKQKHIHIGTSGWHYGHWEGPFYPKDISSDEYLKYYSKHFHTVEVNNTFYKIPDEKTIREWRDTVPKRFIFSVKASRYITHMKKLKDPDKGVPNLISAISLFENKLGPILFQLPPNWHANPERLEAFIISLPRNYDYAFEFRDTSWFHDHIYKILERYNTAFCIYELGDVMSPKIITSDLIYIRLHGPAGPYKGQYKTSALEEWAKSISKWSNHVKKIYCYFDNDEAGYAPRDAMRLQDMV